MHGGNWEIQEGFEAGFYDHSVIFFPFFTVSFFPGGKASIREDTHKKSVFFSGRTTKGLGRINPPDH